MGYDPRAHGAQCDRCPLNGLRAVPPEVGHACTRDAIRNRTAVAIVGEAPGEQEERTGRPFVGRSGEELDKALHKAGIPRQTALVTNVLLCRPPKNELRDLLGRIKRSNDELISAHKKAVKHAQANSLPIPPAPELTASPLDCCRPRLEAEIAPFVNFVTLGKVATEAVAGARGSIGALRGSLHTLDATPLTPHRRVLPTVHPAFCMRKPRWFHVFRADIEKAGKWFRGEIEWRPPIVRRQPTPQQLREFIARHRDRALSCDIETDDVESLTARIRCVGIGTEDEVLVVSVLSKEERGKKLYSAKDEAEIIDIFRAYFEDPEHLVIGQNFGGYDKVVLRQQWGIEVRGIVDTMQIHRVVESELPHSLAYIVSMYTIAPAWKTDRDGQKLSTDSESDEALAVYCGMDVALTARVLAPLIAAMKERDQVSVYLGDMKIQAVCADMHTAGMYVDQAVRQKTEIDILKRRHRVLADIRGYLGDPTFNPGSIYQLRDILFDKWQLVPPLDDTERLTSKMDPSTSDLVLRALMTDPALKDDPRRQFIQWVRIYRKLQKVLGTYVVKLRPWTELAEGDLGWDEDEEDAEGWANAELRKRYGIAKRGIVNPYTGRMYPGYNSAVAVTGRLSSSKPMNCFDGETEILTPRGWVRFDELPEGLPVAQWQNDGAISFAVPTAYHRGEYVGPMVHFVSQSADLLMTPNHRIPLLKASGSSLETVTAHDLLSIKFGRDTIHAGQLVRPNRASLPITLDELRLLVAIHADGSFTQYGIDIGFKKTRKVERFTALLAAVDGYEWRRSPANEKRFYLYRTPALDRLLGLIQGNARLWGEWLLQLSEFEARAFEEEIWLWDGCFDRLSQYANKDKRNVDLVQAFLVTRGIRANVRLYTNTEGHSVWTIDVRRTRTNAITPRRQCTETPYAGQVYCVTVPADAIVVRRNGKVTVTRQSQNFPAGMRTMVTAAPGHVLVGADMDQLELRIAAARWGVKLYLRAFAEGKDPHSMTAFAVFGEAFCRAAGLDPRMFEREGPLVGDAYEDGKFARKDGEAYKMRTLSKMVQYACVEENEKVAVLGPEGAKPIREMQIGDWTWAWSRQRHRYEPTRVTEVMPRGTKPCVRVHFAWGRGDRWHGSVVVTTDHLCIMRDGTEREAGSLRPGDRLMPFRRSTIGRYRRVFPFNTGASAGEHRAVVGIYEPGDGRDVHHVNRNTSDNRPENLEPLAPLPHFEEHAEDLAAGRRRSVLWRASVSDSATRSRASLKSWQGRKTRRATDKAYALRSFLEDWREVIGVLPDAEVAERAGCTPPAVAYFRKTRGIAPPVGQRGWLQHLFDTQDAWTDRLCGDLVALSKDIREVFGVHVELTTLRRERRRRITEYRDSLGHVPDGVLADRLGTSTADVAKERETHGIPLYYQDEPGGTNHRVTRLEFIGDRDVWDIEVDHEDHNFALESGIFVHNSQYKAAVETVAMLIRKTEVAARDEDGNERTDGTTDLPYALLPLRRVREMHGNWLRGAPEFKRGWDKEIAHFKRHGFVQEYVTGRKRYFLDTAQSNDDFMSGSNEIVNFPIQCVPGHTRVLVEYGYAPIQELEGRTFRAWTGKKWASATCIRKGTADIWRVRTKGRLALECDLSHSFRRRDGSWVSVRELKSGDEVEVDCSKCEFGRPRLDERGEYLGDRGVPIPADGSVPDEIWRASWDDRAAYATRLFVEVSSYSHEQHLLMQTIWPTDRWVKVESVVSTHQNAPVYTLCVEDEDHSYVAEGFISKNSTAAGLMNNAIIELHRLIPLHKWGPGTGIINQCHDSIVIECPADGAHVAVDPKTGKKKMVVPPGSIPDRVAKLLEECMNSKHDSLPGVEFTATASVGLTWKEV